MKIIMAEVKPLRLCGGFIMASSQAFNSRKAIRVHRVITLKTHITQGVGSVTKSGARGRLKQLSSPKDTRGLESESRLHTHAKSRLNLNVVGLNVSQSGATADFSPGGCRSARGWWAVVELDVWAFILH